MSNKSTGTVKFFMPKKGYGFITDDDTGEDIFVHISGLQSNVKTLQKEDSVSFEKDKNKKGVFAHNVEKL